MDFLQLCLIRQVRCTGRPQEQVVSSSAISSMHSTDSDVWVAMQGKVEPKFLVQGTLYPDVIESCPPPGSGQKHSHTIKSHHNVGGLPKDLQFSLIEPLRELFKVQASRPSCSRNVLMFMWAWLGAASYEQACSIQILQHSMGCNVRNKW